MWVKGVMGNDSVPTAAAHVRCALLAERIRSPAAHAATPVPHTDAR
ncbi:hypothetical protein FTUN_1287 [Frigoriglobus tundricola]|uniref:Uncharacterized protein n=1 Tax=Frigoriglobus tundricola TaxID=2774151 RepID=A0A6M5YKG5_9BACT|nr:hypothetical protein FTUN_1287 [Frigoriglobus tundricola]